MGTEPLRLFKYFPARRSDFLTKLRLRFTPPHEFNDAFEMLPRVDGDVRKLERHVAIRLAKKHYRKAGFASATEFRREVRKHLGPAYERELFDDVHERFLKGLQKNVGKYVGVLSLTRNPSSLLMWAHYADCHRGFVVEFNPMNSFFRLEGGPVIYARRRVPLIEGQTEGEILLTKSREWAYEREYRFFGAADQCSNYLVPIPLGAIKAVYLGCRMAPQNINRFRAALRLPGRHHIGLFQTTRAVSSYELELKTVSLT
jgi:hypothetical protein